jgi:hypothetical protein
MAYTYSNYSKYYAGPKPKRQPDQKTKIIEELKKNFDWDLIKRELEKESERNLNRYYSYYPSNTLISSGVTTDTESWWRNGALNYEPVAPVIEPPDPSEEDVDFDG